MKKISLIFLSIIFINSVYSQCTAPAYNVDLSAQTDTSWTLIGAHRDGICCGSSNCVTFNVTINEGTELISFDVTNPSPSGSAFYQVNCGTPVSIGTPLCVVGIASPFTITYCKPGGDSPDYIITAGTVVHASNDISIHITGCTDTLFVDNVQTSSIVWTSIYPGNQGDYDSYLSCTTGCNTTLVTPDLGAPPYVDYEVSGNPNVPCGSYSKDTVRVYFVPHLQGWITPASPVICASSGDDVTLIANASDGATPYHYHWSTGPNSQSITVSSAGTYTVTISDHTNCPPINVTRTIGTIPSASFDFSYDDYCKNESDQLPVFTSGQAGTFSASPAGLVFVSTSTGEIDISASSTGTYLITNTIAPSGTCPGASDTASVTINPYPSMTSTTSATVCSGEPINIALTADISSTFSWIATNNINTSGEDTTEQISTAIIDTIINITGNNEIVSYTVTPVSTLSGSCIGSPQTVNITVVPNDDPSFTYASSTHCQSGVDPSPIITGLAGGTFSSTGGLVFVDPSTGEIDLSASSVGSYIVTYTTNGTCPKTASYPINITLAPSAIFGYINSPFCEDETNPFPDFGPGASGGTFTSTAGLVFVNATTGEVNLANSIPGTYTVTNTIAAAGGCSDAIGTNSITITEHLASSFIYPQEKFCQNDANPFPVFTGSGVAGTFSAPAGLVIDPATGEINLAASTPGTYPITNTIAAAGGCPVDISSYPITITALPIANFSYDGSPYCQNGTDPLPTLEAGSTTGAFTASSIYLHVNATSGLVDLASSDPGTYIVTNTIVAANGCPKVTDTALITITELPIADLSYLNTPYCQTASDPTPIIVPGGSNGIFTSTPAGLVIESSSGTVDLASSLPGSYTVTNTIAAAAGCEEVTASTPITITELPNATIIYDGTPYCNSVSTPQVINHTGSTAGTFTAPAGLTIDTNTGEITPSSSAVGTYTVTYTIPAAAGCGVVTETTDVTISDLPVASIDYTGSPFCNAEAISAVTLTGNTGGTYSAPAGLTIDSNTGEVTPSSSTPNTYLVTYTIPAANGCPVVTANANVVINEIPTASSSSLGINCNGESADVIVTASGGLSPYTGEGTFTEYVGTFTYTITDDNGCTASTSITLTEPDELIASSSATPILCYGGTSTLTVSATGGTMPYTGDGDYTLSTGLYSYTVTDDKGCESVTNINIPEPTDITSSVSTTLAGCGLSDGTATVSASGGTGTIYYEWPSANTNALETGLAAGTYIVTITDDNNCNTTATAYVINSNAPVVTQSSVDILCHGLSTGSIDLNVSGGTGLYTYNWNSGAYSTEDLTNIPAGVYNYDIVDEANCHNTGSVTIVEPDTLVASSSATTILCHSDTALVTITAVGGFGAYIGTGDFDAVAGTYDFIVIDANGCADTTYIIIDQPDTLIASSIATDILCYGDTSFVTISATGGFGAYTGIGILAEFAGTYTYSVTDANGCIDSTTIVISQPDTLIASSSATDILCNGGTSDITVNAVGGAGLYTGTGTFNVNAGTYNYTVTDDNSCSSSTSITIDEPTVVTTSITSTLSGCGLSNASATVSASGGTDTLTYLWSPIGGTDSVAIGLAAGTYTVLTQDANGCSVLDTVVINNSENPTAITNQVDILCNGLSTGSIDLSVSGGISPYTFDWNSGTFTSEDIDSLAAGTYDYIVIDSANCQATGTVIILEPVLLTSDIINTSTLLCSYSTDGQAVVEAYGGTLPYNYIWSDVVSTANDTISSLAGNIEYYVTITDDNGCTVIDTVLLTAPTQISITGVSNNALCGIDNGSISITPTGGTSPFTYLWNNNSTNSSISDLAAGSYSATVTDANSCTSTYSSSLTSIPDGMIEIDMVNNVLCHNDSTGSISISMLGGTAPFTYQWNIAGETNANVEYLAAGIYTVTVTDANSCEADTIIIINQPDAITISDTLIITEINTGDIDITVTGGTFPYSYIWSNNETTEDISDLANDDYIVTVTDINSCIIIDTITVDIQAIDILIPTLFTPNNDGINDDFEIKNIQAYDKVSVEIFNRWGDQIFLFDGTGQEYADQVNRWDGKYNGNDMPMGGYVYIVVIEGLNPFTGVITIKR